MYKMIVGSSWSMYTRDNTYLIHDNGCIERTDIDFMVSEQWVFHGVVDRYGRFLSFAEFKTIISRESILYKNGKGKYYPIDIDHGTMRQWNKRIIAFYKMEGVK